MKVSELVGEARSQLTGLTGLPLGSTLGVSKLEDAWKVEVELVEKKSIPDSMDILATYEVILDEEGGLVEFHRRSMRKRIDAEQLEVVEEEI